MTSSFFCVCAANGKLPSCVVDLASAHEPLSQHIPALSAAVPRSTSCPQEVLRLRYSALSRTNIGQISQNHPIVCDTYIQATRINPIQTGFMNRAAHAVSPTTTRPRCKTWASCRRPTLTTTLRHCAAFAVHHHPWRSRRSEFGSDRCPGSPPAAPAGLTSEPAHPDPTPAPPA